MITGSKFGLLALRASSIEMSNGGHLGNLLNYNCMVHEGSI